MRFGGPALVCVFAAVTMTGAALARTGQHPAGPRPEESSFFCEQFSDCLVDVREVLRTVNATTEALTDLERRESARRAEALRKLETEEAAIEELIRSGAGAQRAVQRVAAAASSCYDLRDELGCRAPRSVVNRILAKVRFREGLKADQAGQGPDRVPYLRFQWDEQNRDFARRRLAQAICEGGTPISAWLALEAIDLFNTTCFRAPTRRLRLLGLINVDLDETVCRNAQYLNFHNTVQVSGSFLHNASLRAPGRETTDFFPRLLDHELAHARFRGDPAFERAAIDFLSYRFVRVLPQLLSEMRSEFAALSETPRYRSASEAERLVLIDDIARPVMIRHRIPIRTDLARGLSLRLTDGEISTGLDGHALDGGGGEYIAYAIEIYLHAPDEAAALFSRAELAWLERHAGR